MLSARCSGCARPYEFLHQHLHFARAYVRSLLERAGPSHHLDFICSLALLSHDGMGANFRSFDRFSRIPFGKSAASRGGEHERAGRFVIDTQSGRAAFLYSGISGRGGRPFAAASRGGGGGLSLSWAVSDGGGRGAGADGAGAGISGQGLPDGYGANSAAAGDGQGDRAGGDAGGSGAFAGAWFALFFDRPDRTGGALVAGGAVAELQPGNA